MENRPATNMLCSKPLRKLEPQHLQRKRRVLTLMKKQPVGKENGKTVLKLGSLGTRLARPLFECVTCFYGCEYCSPFLDTELKMALRVVLFTFLLV